MLARSTTGSITSTTGRRRGSSPRPARTLCRADPRPELDATRVCDPCLRHDCGIQGLVREGGVEPPHPFGHTDLNRARLPIPPLAREPKSYTSPRDCGVA